MSKELNNSLPLFKLEEGKYYITRGGWIARVIYISKIRQLCYAVHNPGNTYEVGPILHDIKTGYALYPSVVPFLTPPAYSGHPADLIEEAVTN